MKAFVQNRQIFFICLVPILGFGIFLLPIRLYATFLRARGRLYYWPPF